MTEDDNTRRTFDPDDVAAAQYAPEALRHVAGLSVPCRVGPYFVTDDEEGMSLSDYATESVSKAYPVEAEGWVRLGSDGAFELCGDTKGAVWAVLLDYEEPRRFVNASLSAFAASLDALHQALGVIFTTDRPDTAAEAFDQLSRTLKETDPTAFGDAEDWWPRVLEDIRHTASAPNYAAFEYVDPEHGKRIVTQAGAIAAHPEERLWSALRAAGVQPEDVLRIHTDLEPCFMPGHYCSLWMAQTFPEAKFTHSFPYGETAASRAEGIQQLLANAQTPPDGAGS